MDATALNVIARWTEGTLVAGSPAGTVANVCTDSRALKAGDCFVALRGDKFDGHRFIEEAAKRRGGRDRRGDAGGNAARLR